MINGLHHMTAIASDAQANVDFYVGVLGLRLVKKTINYDDPKTYHLYYGDYSGTPGSILTFFPWPGASRGRAGVGETQATALLIPRGSLEKWETYLRAQNVAVGEKTTRFHQTFLPFTDHDGTSLELVEGDERTGGSETAIVRMAGVALRLASTDATEKLLTERLGFTFVQSDGDAKRYVSGSSFVDLLVSPEEITGKPRLGAGSVHHVAWRVANDAEQTAIQHDLHDNRVGVTDVKDRQYFHSIYFKEPGGVLFEIATDPPGFTADEPLEGLGSRLGLPEWLETDRAAMEKQLTALTVPAQGGLR